MRKLVVSLGAQTGSSRSRPTLAHLPRACEASAQFPCRTKDSALAVLVARRRVRQRDELWRIRLPCGDCLSEGRLPAFTEVFRQSVLPDEDSQSNVWQRGEDAFMPKRRTLGTWRQVSAVASTGIAQAHRHDREPSRVIEHRFLDPQPLPQPFSAGVVPRDPAFMNLKPWCLTNHQDASGR